MAVPRDGIAYALQYALSTYVVAPSTLRASHIPVRSRFSDEIGGRESGADDAWTQRLLAAIDSLKDAGGLARFSNRMRSLGGSPSLSDHEVLAHFEGALVSYYENREIGISPDPF
jgi:hypothetical protein